MHNNISTGSWEQVHAHAKEIMLEPAQDPQCFWFTFTCVCAYLMVVFCSSEISTTTNNITRCWWVCSCAYIISCWPMLMSEGMRKLRNKSFLLVYLLISCQFTYSCFNSSMLEFMPVYIAQVWTRLRIKLHMLGLQTSHTEAAGAEIVTLLHLNSPVDRMLFWYRV